MEGFKPDDRVLSVGRGHSTLYIYWVCWYLGKATGTLLLCGANYTELLFLSNIGFLKRFWVISEFLLCRIFGWKIACSIFFFFIILFCFVFLTVLPLYMYITIKKKIIVLIYGDRQAWGYFKKQTKGFNPSPMRFEKKPNRLQKKKKFVN